jgi:hypothetical protein
MRKMHAPYYMAINVLSGSTIFSPHCLINGKTFGKDLRQAIPLFEQNGYRKSVKHNESLMFV